MATRILVILILLDRRRLRAAAATSSTIGIYAPTVEFGTAQARLAYLQGLAKAIEQNTGIKTEAQSYATIGALKKDNVDYAIIDGACYAGNLGWMLLANANIGGSTTRTWALYSSTGDTIAAVKGKKLAFVAAGCNDNGFIDNAMFESEVDPTLLRFARRREGSHRGDRLGGFVQDRTSGVRTDGAAKGLTKVYEASSVPNPAFVEMNSKLPQSVTEKVATAVVGYGGSGAITGWAKPAKEPYQALAGRLAPVKKAGQFAQPEPGRLGAVDPIVDPPTLKDPAAVAVRHHWLRPPGARME